MKQQIISENWEVTPSSIKSLDDAIADITPNDKKLLNWYRKYAKGQKKRLSYDIDYVQRFAQPKSKILEFGSAPFILTTALKRLQYDVVGLDLKPGRFRSIIEKDNLVVKRIDFEITKLPLEDNTFDVAVFNEVFEHLRINPVFTLKEVHRVLAPNGLLMLSTPNLMSWKGWYNFVFKSKLPPNLYDEYMKLQHLGHMGHVRLYSPVEVITFLGRIGFKVETIIYRGEWQSTSKFKRRMGNLFLKLFPKYRTFFSVVARKV
ncbi:class I SAM-dependent methyltransferase [Neptunicella sp.]|uniref:class I SAM-dependent methyltransferase n=1 Tax=Neptunicella sp. TaxID=2125986 RepID=UPI003F693149